MPKTSTWNGLEERSLGLSDSGWIDMSYSNSGFTNISYVMLAFSFTIRWPQFTFQFFNLDVVTMARENDAIIYTLVPHTTHEIQTLDAAVFRPLKCTWQEVCHNYISHPGRIITTYQFN